ncbi:MAG: type II toxin-antitoxin system RelE family toxin, partial [Spirochaetaceae bacterium]
FYIQCLLQQRVERNSRRGMSYKVVLIPEAQKDYKKLDGSIKKYVNKKIDELADNPFLGEQLGNKFNIDLTGFFKIYIAKKSYRIVYRLISPSQIEIIEIWGIGKRSKEEIYRIIGKRLTQQKAT